ncbi:MAG TPA: arginase [Bryobacteraceae bacterium]|nr:arginase [Bryobacteraceae bacterium]
MRTSRIAIIGAPLDLGQDRRGVDMGPSALRVANINRRVAALGYEVLDLGNVPVVQPESYEQGDSRARYVPQIESTCRLLGEMVIQALEEGQAPVVIGGDHSAAIGTIGGVSSFFRGRDEKIGLVWVDAHADMNTPDTSPSGNVHGMPLACVVGMGPPELAGLFGFGPKVDPANVAIVGLRDVDLPEKPHVRASGVKAFTMRDIDERGMKAVMQDAIRIARQGTAGFHLSLDMDFIDPQWAPGVGTPVRGGGTYRETHLAMELICDSGAMVSMEVVEVNPVIDESNRTADLAVELVLSALGKRIL